MFELSQNIVLIAVMAIFVYDWFFGYGLVVIAVCLFDWFVGFGSLGKRQISAFAIPFVMSVIAFVSMRRFIIG